MSIIDSLQDKTISGPVELYIKEFSPIFSLNKTFAGCYGITSFKAPYMEGTLQGSTFAGFDKLETVAFDSITSAGASCFSSCSSLRNISLPMLITAGTSCFRNCSSLQSMSLPLVKSLSSSCFDGCASLRDVELPNVTSIGANCFNACSSLERIELPYVTSLTSAVFQYCSNLRTVILPSIQAIGASILVNNTPFPYCNIDTLDLGDNVKNIGYLTRKSLDTTGSIENLIVRNTTPPSLFNAGCMDPVTNIYVHDEDIERYRSARYWSDTAVVSKIKPLSQYVEA